VADDAAAVAEEEYAKVYNPVETNDDTDSVVKVVVVVDT
jgi:hypothetical protein